MLDFIQSAAGLTKASDILDDFYKQKCFTHAHLTFSPLSLSEPFFSKKIIPGNRDIFDLASITKAVVIVPLIWREIESGRLNLNTTLGAWLGKRAAVFDTKLSQLSVSSLLEHCSGLPPWSNLWVNSLALKPSLRRAELIARLNLCSHRLKPNKKRVYSDLGYILLGLAFEEYYQLPLSVLFMNFCKRDLQLNKLDLFFPNPLSTYKSFVPTSYCFIRSRWLVGEVHDENAASLGGEAGHAGLFGTANGLHKFLSSFLGSSFGSLFLEDALKKKSKSWDTLETMPEINAIGHLGFTGTAFWYRHEFKDLFILLSNRVIRGRCEFEKVRELRKQLYTLLLG